MNFYKLYISLLLFYTQTSISQTFIVDYNLILGNNTQMDSINNKIEKLDSDLKINFSSVIEYTLIHSKQYSIFKSYKDLDVFTKTKNSDLDFLNKYKLNDFTSIIFKDFKLKNSKQREFIIDKPFIISDSLSDHKWILTNKQKKINGFSCFSAETIDSFGSKVTAWFTGDIPISNGPGDFHGLPGLIIIIEADDYIFEMTSIKSISKNISLNFEEKGTVVNTYEFIKIYEEKVLLKK
jgi:GLPGLI family protein